MKLGGSTIRMDFTDFSDEKSHQSPPTSTSEGLTLAYVPGFRKAGDLLDQYCRMLWYAHPLLDDLERICVSSSFTPSPRAKLPKYMDPGIESLVEHFEGKIWRFDYDDETTWRRCLEQADIILHWDLRAAHPNRTIHGLIEKALKKKKRYRVDRRNEQYEGSMYLKLSHDANRSFDADLAESRDKFLRMVREVGKHRKGYIFGTGPSLAEAMNMDFSDGVTIACNSMAKNESILEKLQPTIFVIADPIFHAGCSSYAGKFRQYLCKVLDTYGCYLIVPFRDYKLYMANLPERFQGRIVGIPLEHLDHINLDLTERFAVKSISNILTLFLIPLACTLFKEVGIVGCDGRRLEEDGYFWPHHKASQLNEEMEKIKLAHPSFFAIDYNDYYRRHCQTLEQWLREGQRMGVTFRNLTPSYIPALQIRSAASVTKKAAGKNDNKVLEEEPLVSIVMPARNAAGTIARTIESVRTDSYQNWELLVTDDHSTDNTQGVVRAIADKDPRVKYLSNSGSGVSAARNCSLKNASGSLIGFLDSDDVYFEGALATRVQYLQRHPKTRAVYCPTVMANDKLEELWRLRTRPVITFRDMHTMPCHLNAVIMRAELAKANRFDENLTVGEDWVYLQRIARSGVKVHLVDNCSVAYVLHPGSTILRDTLSYENGLLKVLSLVYQEDPDCPNPQKKYRKGLSEPPLEQTILQRRFRLLVELLLAGDDAKARKLAGEFAGNIWQGISARDAARTIKIAIMRQSFCNKKQWAKHWSDRARKVKAFFEAYLPEKTFPNMGKRLYAEIDRLAAEDSPRSQPPPEEKGIGFEEIRLVHEYLKDSANAKVMIDVGAHYGQSSRLFLHAGWKVYAFEPDPANRKKLMELAKEYPKLSIDPRAVSDTVRAQVPFYKSDVSPAISALNPFHPSHVETGGVEITTLVAFCESAGIREVDFLKVDVEGYDLFVLKGFPWDTIKPAVVMCEFENYKTSPLGYEFHDLAGFLVDRGYQLLISEWYPVERYGGPHTWNRLAVYPCELFDPNGWGNIIAFRGELDSAKLLTCLGKIASRGQIMIRNRERAIDSLRREVKEQQSRPPKSARLKQWKPSRLGKRLSYMTKAIVKWHLRWGGLGLLAALGLFAWAFLRMPGGVFAGLAGVAVIYVTIAYVFVRARAEAQGEVPAEREHYTATAQQLVASARNWTALELSKRDQTIRDLNAAIEKTAAIEQRRSEAMRATTQELLRAIRAEKEERVAQIALRDRKPYQSYDRRLTDDDEKQFLNVWSEKLDLKLTVAQLRYCQQRISYLEDNCLGRLAGDVQDAILRILIGMSTAGKEVNILEIGTLFGVNSIILHDILSCYFEKVNLTLIDPLDGYYAKGKLDVLTGLPVDPSILERNFNRAMIARNDWRVIQARSSDKAALEAASGKSYDIVFVDGDHSYQGVKRDFELYAPLVTEAGYMVFDDYHNDGWPDVTKVVDELVMKSPQFTCVGLAWESAVFRKKRSKTRKKTQKRTTKKASRKTALK